MLNLTKIVSVNKDAIENITFDLGIFASGYEERSSFLARQLKKDKILDNLVLGFHEHSLNNIRKSNDFYYSTSYSKPVIISTNDECNLYIELNKKINSLKDRKRIRILLDYTSMSRLWYAGILNFFKMQEDIEVEIYLNYTFGKYVQKPHDYSYISINSLPSQEGLLSTNTRTLLVLSIGFYPEIARSVIDEIEPNDIIGILPIPSLNKKNEELTSISKQYLENDIDYWLNCPVYDLENIYRTYAEITSNNINEKDIIFLSLGPKIFTIASILVGQKFEQVTCLYLKSKHNDLNNIEASGDLICSKVIYQKDGNN